MPTLDPALSLAFLLHQNPGAYALLIGSGVSRASGIPTGWEIVLDLVRQVAVLQEQDPPSDPLGWYRTTFGEEPDYSGLLLRLAPTAPERQAVLRRYFEPTDEERDQGRKLPSRAHAAIARLAENGCVRVVITTNFDRLLEMALEREGVPYHVISTADAVEGALPFALAPVTVVKVNGDYLDTRIRNTVGELTRYEPPLESLLDRIFDEFGVIACGWSGEWDVSLRDAVSRCASRRFSWFWCHRAPAIPTVTETMLSGRAATRIAITDADSFFEQLETKVRALREADSPHPVSIAAAVATVKRYIPEERHRIRLEDFVREETERTVETILSHDFAVDSQITDEEVVRRVSNLGSATDQLANVLAAGCYFGAASQDRLWVGACERLFQLPYNGAPARTYFPHLVALGAYPAVMTLYSAGLAALAAGRLDSLSMLFAVKVRPWSGEEVHAITSELFTDRRYANALLPRHHTPLSDHLFDRLRDTLRPYLADDAAYGLVFDRFEYFAALHSAHLADHDWGPPGRFAWNGGRVASKVREEFAQQQSQWKPLQAGLFGGSVESFEATANRLYKGHGNIY